MPKITKNYKRVLLKISGEGFCSEEKTGIEAEKFASVASEIKKSRSTKAQIAIVLGGGNILRGAKLSETGFDRTSADQLGMIATVMNAIILKNHLEIIKVPSCVLSAIQIHNIVETYNVSKCIDYLNSGKVVIVAGGTGNPYFTTDTAAALRAIEIGADVFLKGTKVDGVYSDDPKTNSSAKKYVKLNYFDVLEKKLAVMDSTAISLSMDNDLPIVVFNFRKKNNIAKAIEGTRIGTYIGKSS
ncbi:MAG: UMP kinase [Candidatus Scalindua sp. AMX11]|nr:MAG: UMP kinase [Candidatus Scalindua sp.]NOG85285.1 UMP kinase [Planctomycetota bacterium]RZV81496.1 MAG: UMP kinase [Candidatus Scalindua sp. SCAELEC01]TDE65431.1 MAG: UMP kinase [Candidatus Scalindua sp. AMX11]GJQ59353.1 MAG: uridylate kinase [Candidatus Scalindua sp.]